MQAAVATHDDVPAFIAESLHNLKQDLVGLDIDAKSKQACTAASTNEGKATISVDQNSCIVC
jgi:hypothetical protein